MYLRKQYNEPCEWRKLLLTNKRTFNWRVPCTTHDYDQYEAPRLLLVIHTLAVEQTFCKRECKIAIKGHFLNCNPI